MRIGNKRDFLAGLLLVGFGLAALLIARNYRMGTAFRMGPGYFPVDLAILLIVIGIIVAGIALRSGKEVAMPQVGLAAALHRFRPQLCSLGCSSMAPALLVMTFALVVVSRLARPGYPWVETVVLGVALSVLCAAVFYFGLKIQMPLLPTWWG